MKKTLKKILYIDDDADIITIVKICLRNNPDIEFKSCLSGIEALKIIPEFQPDLILLDVMMPDIDGIETLKRIKQLPSFDTTPIVFLTAKVQQNEVKEYFKYGILDVIIKPFNPKTFSTDIQKIWEKAQSS